MPLEKVDPRLFGDEPHNREHEELWGPRHRALESNVDVICRHPTIPHAPQEHWQMLTVLGAMSTRRLLASMTIAAPTDGAIFLAYVEQVLWRGSALGLPGYTNPRTAYSAKLLLPFSEGNVVTSGCY
jgi:hypothetical protein